MSSQGHILIIDDEEQLRKLLSRLLSLEGFTIEEAGSLKTGMELLQRRAVDVVLCDVKLPDGSGVDFVTDLKKHFPLPEVILLTAYGNISDGVQAIKNGAFDYITKGNDNHRILPLLRQAMDKVANARKKSFAIKQGDALMTFENIIGKSKRIKEVIHLAQKIAPKSATVLLLGETGTGKEVFAFAIHAASTRAQQPFITINCSAFGRELLENELFGHTAEAYTGATKDKKGLISLADKGTLFLDEIGEMHIDLQAKLLRVLENGEFIKVGDVKTTKVDVRIIAATNRNLEKEVAEKRFREDLYYRLHVFTIELPPLRERLEDIPLLADHFLSVNKDAAQRKMHLGKAACDMLLRHPWKGNIRELKNVLQRAVILSDDDNLLPEHFPYDIQSQQSDTGNQLSLTSIEKKHIEKVLQHTGGNKTRTAELLGIGLTTLYRKIEEYHIDTSR